MKASRADQRSLIDVAGLDGVIGKLRYELANLPIDVEITDASEVCSKYDKLLASQERKIADIKKLMSVAEANISDLQATIASKEEKLNAGTGMDSRQLMVLQSEIEGHRSVVDEREIDLLSAMEDLEDIEDSYAGHLKERQVAGERLSGLTAQRDAQRARLNDDIADASRQRQEIAASIETKLLAVYEEARVSGGGLVTVSDDGQVDGGMSLSVTEMEAVKALGEDEVYLSDEGALVLKA